MSEDGLGATLCTEVGGDGNENVHYCRESENK